MDLRRSTANDVPVLLEVWLRSVRATHTFLTDTDIASLLPAVQRYLTTADFWVACATDGTPIAFMGLTGNSLDALFVTPRALSP